MSKPRPKAPTGKHWVYTTQVKLKSGRTIFARNYGKKAFVFLAKNK